MPHTRREIRNCKLGAVWCQKPTATMFWFILLLAEKRKRLGLEIFVMPRPHIRRISSSGGGGSCGVAACDVLLGGGGGGGGGFHQNHKYFRKGPCGVCGTGCRVT